MLQGFQVVVARPLCKSCIAIAWRTFRCAQEMAKTRSTFANGRRSSYRKSMLDLKLQVPVTEEVEVSQETLAAIDCGVADADNGRTVSIEEVRKLIPEWISKFESQKPR
jgi:predicted transcriptional regulator